MEKIDISMFYQAKWKTCKEWIEKSLKDDWGKWLKAILDEPRIDNCAKCLTAKNNWTVKQVVYAVSTMS